MGDSCPYLVIICFSFLILAGESAARIPNCPFYYIYQFGDGVADIGNSIRTIPSGPTLPAAHPPYGMTYPGRPTGRWCDGRLILDWAARALGITRIKPYLDRRHSANDGVVFAVEGSPVLDVFFYASKGVRIPNYAVPLNVQLEWFREYGDSAFSTPTDFKNRLANSLFSMGDIEGNDIRYPLLQGKSIEEIQRDYVPLVIETLINGTREVIRAGANRITIPGNVPLGCYPSILSAFPSINPLDYDDLGCLKSVNNLVMFRNNILETAVRSLRLEFPDVTILYADYYSVVESVMRRAALLGVLPIIFTGFDNSTLVKTCCGHGGGKYNYDERMFCGTYGVPVCSNIKKHIHWDGKHLTNEANYKISEIIIAGLLPSLGCL